MEAQSQALLWSHFSMPGTCALHPQWVKPPRAGSGAPATNQPLPELPGTSLVIYSSVRAKP